MFLLLSTPQPCQLLDGRDGGSEPDESHTKHCKISINKEVIAFRNRSEPLTSHNFPLLLKEWETYSVFSGAWIFGNVTLHSSFYQVRCSLPVEGEDRVVPRYCNTLLRPVFKKGLMILYVQIISSSVPLADCSSLITWETQDGYTSTAQHLLLMMCNFTDTDFKPVCWVQSARCCKSKMNSPPQAARRHRLQPRECVEMRSRGVMMMKVWVRLQQAAVNEILIRTVTVNTMLCSVLVLDFEIHEWTHYS